MKKLLSQLLTGLFYSCLFSIVIVAVLYFFLTRKAFIGPILIIFGFVVLTPVLLKHSLRDLKSEIAFGIVDNGILAITALVGAELFGVLGAIIGGLVGNTFTDGLAGAFEGYYARKKDNRDPLLSSLGKMAGCLFGAGIVLIFAWTLFS